MMSGDKSTINIVEKEAVEWDEPTVITGFPGPGYVGETTAMFIIDSLKLREVGHVSSEFIPPMLVVMGQNFRPPFRIHANEDGDLMIIVDNQPIPMEHHRIVSRSLMGWLNGKHVKEIVVLDGLPVPDETLEGRIIGFSINEKRLLELGRYGVMPLRGGAVTGMNAGLLEICQEQNVPWTGLLAPTTRIGSPNWRGITSIIEVLNKMLDLNIDASVIRRTVSVPGERLSTKTKANGKGNLFSMFRKLVR